MTTFALPDVSYLLYGWDNDLLAESCWRPRARVNLQQNTLIRRFIILSYSEYCTSTAAFYIILTGVRLKNQFGRIFENSPSIYSVIELRNRFHFAYTRKKRQAMAGRL